MARLSLGAKSSAVLTVRVLAVAVCSVGLGRNLLTSVQLDDASGSSFLPQHVEETPSLTTTIRNDGNAIQLAFQAVLRNTTGETKSLEILYDRLGKMDVFDQAINHTVEAQRCARYGFTYNESVGARRRIFWGSLIADDSWHTLGITAMENFGMFHTVAFVESNRTHRLFPRKWRFLEGSENLGLLQSGMFGPDTKVTVDSYLHEEDMAYAKGIFQNKLRGYEGEMIQREAVLERWKKNGMQLDDIGILGDVDEVWTRDFLRAAQICNVPALRLGNNCRNALLRASGIDFEGSPQCIMKGRRIMHPGMIMGECINHIGNESKHKPGPRSFVERNPRPNVTVPAKFNGTRGFRSKGYGGDDDWSKFAPNTQYFPLWNAADYRLKMHGRLGPSRYHTSFHFHNFFMSPQAIRFKYKTYGEVVKDAEEKSVSKFHDDTKFMVDCVLNQTRTYYGGKYSLLEGGVKGINGPVPIAFQSDAYVAARHNELSKIVLSDEEKFNSQEQSQ